MSLLSRFPPKEQIIPVYAVGVAILYPWTIVTNLKEFTENWILYFGLTDIFNLFAYVLAGAFLESLILIGSLLFISFVFPKIKFSTKFILYGTTLTITFLSSLMFLYSQTWPIGTLEHINKWIVFFLISTGIALFLVEKIKVVERIIILIASNCIIFLYIYVPVSALSIIVILVRNAS